MRAEPSQPGDNDKLAGLALSWLLLQVQGLSRLWKSGDSRWEAAGRVEIEWLLVADDAGSFCSL